MRNVLFALGIVIVIVVAFAFISCSRGSRNTGLTASLGGSMLGGSSANDDGAGRCGGWENPPVQRSIDEVIAEVRAYEPPSEVASSSGFDAQVFELLRDELVRALEARRDRGVSMLPSRSGAVQRPLLYSVQRPVMGAQDARGASGGGRDDPIELDDVFVQPMPEGTNELRFSFIIPGDFDGDGEVGVADITPIAVNYLQRYGDGKDANGDVELIGDGLDRTLVIAGNGTGLMGEGTSSEIGIPFITTIAENYLSSGPAGFDIWRAPMAGGTPERILNAGNADTPTVLRDSAIPTGLASRKYTFMDTPPATPSSVREASRVPAWMSANYSVQRPVLDAPDWFDGIIAPTTGRSTGRGVSVIDGGVPWSNGNFYYIVEPRLPGELVAPQSPKNPKFNVLIKYDSKHHVDVGEDVTMRVSVMGGVTPVNYTINWGDGAEESRDTGTMEEVFTHAYSQAGKFIPYAAVTSDDDVTVVEDAPPVHVRVGGYSFAPTGLTVSPLGDGVNINWDIIDPDPSEQYYVYWSLRQGCSRPELLTDEPVSGNTFATNIVNRLSGGKSIYFKVTAVRGDLESPFSNEFKWPVEGVQAPTLSKSNESDAAVTLTWPEVPNTAEYDVLGYHVFKSTTTGGPYTQIITDPDPITALTYTYNTLSSENELYFVVSTVANVSESGYSNEVSWFRSLPAPDPPQNPSAVAGNNAVTVSWEASPTAYTSGYKVYYGTKEDKSDIFTLTDSQLAADAREYTVNDDGTHPVENDTRYYFWVTATGAGKESLFTSPVSAVPLNLPPVASFTTNPTLPYQGFMGDSITFTSTSTDDDGSIAMYGWDFDGDGTTDQLGTNSVVQHTYTVEGTFTPRLTVIDDDGATDSAPDAPTENDRVTIGIGSPVAEAGADPLSGNAPLYVDFDATGSSDPDGTIDVYEWQFFPGDTWHDYTSTSGTANHIYNDSGTYIATLRVTDNDGKFATDSVTIAVNQPPTANGNGNPTSGNKPLTVDFNASGSFDPDGLIDKWEWQFYATDTWHDYTSTSGVAQFTYNVAGDFTATLRVTDDFGATATDTVSIHVNAPPIAQCDATPKSGYRPLTVSFNANGSNDPDGSITLYEWDFNGDGAYDWESPTSGDIEYEYTGEATTYTARLRVTDDFSPPATATKTVQITVNNTLPTAKANANPTSGDAPLLVNFNAGGSGDPDGSITLYEWDWTSDGTYDWSNGSSGATSHTYNDNGTFTATLRATDNDDATDTDSVQITVDNPPPVADLQASPTSGNPPLTVNFDASGSYDPNGNIVKYEWDWTNDGNYDLDSDGDATVSHDYTSQGNFTAKVRVTDDDGATATDTILITVSNQLPTADIQASPTEGSPPLTVNFDASLSSDPDGTIVNYEWDWTNDGTYDLDSDGDATVSHEYADAGNYTAKVRVTDDDGATATDTVGITVNNPTWHIETVDSEGNVGRSTSLELDSNDKPHISYYDYTNYDLKYAYFNGSSWMIETVDSVGGGNYTSIALSSNDRPHISYRDETNQDLKYAYYNGSSWEIATVDSAGDVGWDTSIALSSPARPHIGYWDKTNYDLKYAYYNGSSWEISTVDSTGNVGEYTSIALDSNDRPYISYYDYTNHVLKYAYFNGSSWEITTVDSEGSVGSCSSIALDSFDRPHIGYRDASNSDLKYAYYNGSSWVIATVDSADVVGWDTSIALDTTDRPHISYDDWTNYDLKYAYYNGSSWDIATVDSAGDVGWFTSIALDSYDRPHISYWDQTNLDLKYAWFG